MEARASEERILLHERHLEAQLAGADRADVASGAAADDHEIVSLVRVSYNFV